MLKKNVDLCGNAIFLVAHWSESCMPLHGIGKIYIQVGAQSIQRYKS